MGRFSSVDAAEYPRGARVICRTARGLEVGEVLSHAASENGHDSDGSLLRGVTAEDELLLARLEKNKGEAFQACTNLISERGFSAVLMDVEHLFDGQSLYFYFLGEVNPALESLTNQLAEQYEAKVQFRRFAETLVEGCGPGCGTEEAMGMGCTTGSCTTCQVASACVKNA